MAIKIGINGYGRIGRNILRALYEGKHATEIQVIAINDLGDAHTNAHLTRFDTVHGRFRGEVQVDGDRPRAARSRQTSLAPARRGGRVGMHRFVSNQGQSLGPSNGRRSKSHDFRTGGRRH